MNAAISDDVINIKTRNRFVSLDFGRGIAIFIMLFLHIVQRTLDIDALLNNINNEAMINLFALVLIPFFGGLAGFFLIISSASNMVSMYRDLERGKSVRSLVIKQVIGGFLLLIFAMISEGITGYYGVVGFFLRSLNNPAATNWQVILWRWNIFETIHTIAWCLIINGCVQGLLSLKGNWQNKKRMIISYIVLAFTVVGLTQLVWYLVGLIGPGYPYAKFPDSGHQLYLPWIGTESFWEIIRAPFLNPLAGSLEPIFPYLAVSFIGSIIGISISRPKEELSKFPRNAFFVGLAMFIGGLIGIFVCIFQVANTQGFDTAIDFYLSFTDHRAWSPDYASYIPLFAWLGQFLAVNGFSFMLVILLFRLVEFRGKSKFFADHSRFIRRYGTIAFTNYNNQWIFYIVFFFISILVTQTPYKLLPWYGTFVVAIIAYLLYSLILFGWEKIGYIGSFEWFIRTISNSVVPLRKETFGNEIKWWQRGKIDVENNFYNANWMDLSTNNENTDVEIDNIKTMKESKFSLTLSLIGLCSILFIFLTFISLFVSINARKIEGKNKQNTAAFIISIIGIVLIVTTIIVTSILKIGILGIF